MNKGESNCSPSALALDHCDDAQRLFWEALREEIKDAAK